MPCHAMHSSHASPLDSVTIQSVIGQPRTRHCTALAGQRRQQKQSGAVWAAAQLERANSTRQPHMDRTPQSAKPAGKKQ